MSTQTNIAAPLTSLLSDTCQLGKINRRNSYLAKWISIFGHPECIFIHLLSKYMNMHETGTVLTSRNFKYPIVSISPDTVYQSWMKSQTSNEAAALNKPVSGHKKSLLSI